MATMNKITPFLWFDDQAEEAAELYVSLFEGSEITSVSRYTEESAEVSGRAPGSVMTVAFRLAGQPFVALNGGPQYKFSEAISFQISCESQEEVDHFWNALTDGGQELPCGWLKDRFGVAWQVVPTRLPELLGGSDSEGARRATHAMLQMKKLDIGTLERAYQGGD